jgi:hypothetical protein
MRKLLLLFIATITAIFLAGCPDNGVIRDGVVVVDQLPGVSVSSVTPDRVTLSSGEAVPITTGTLLLDNMEISGY